MDSFLGKSRRTDEKVSVLLEPIILPSTSCISEQFRDIQDALQVNVLLPEDFTVYIYHVGNCKWNTFNNQKWIDPRRKKSQKGQTIRVFHCSEPDGWEEIRCDLTSHGSPHTKILGDLIKNSVLVQFKARSAERIAVLSNTTQTRSHAIVLYNTLPAICIEKAGMHRD